MKCTSLAVLTVLLSASISCKKQSVSSPRQAPSGTIPLYVPENRLSLLWWTNFLGQTSSNIAEAHKLLSPPNPVFQNQVITQLANAVQYINTGLTVTVGPRALLLRSVELSKIATETSCDSVSMAVNIQAQKGAKLSERRDHEENTRTSPGGEGGSPTSTTDQTDKLTTAREKANINQSTALSQTVPCLAGGEISTALEKKTLDELEGYVLSASAAGKIFHKYTSSKYMLTYVFEDLASPNYQKPAKVDASTNPTLDELGGKSFYEGSAIPEEYGGGRYGFTMPVMDVLENVEIRWSAAASIDSIIALPEPVRSLAIMNIGKIVPDAVGLSASVAAEKAISKTFNLPMEMEIDNNDPNGLNPFKSKLITNVLLPLCHIAAQNRKLDGNEVCKISKPTYLPDLVQQLKFSNESVVPLSGCRETGTSTGGVMGIGAMPTYKLYFWLSDLNRSIQKGTKVFFYEQSWPKNQLEGWIAVGKAGKSNYQLNNRYNFSQPYMTVESIEEHPTECLAANVAKKRGGRCAMGLFSANGVNVGTKSIGVPLISWPNWVDFKKVCESIDNGSFGVWGASKIQKDFIPVSKPVADDPLNQPVKNIVRVEEKARTDVPPVTPPADVIPPVESLRTGALEMPNP